MISQRRANMNVKLDSDRLDGALPLQNTALSGGRRASAGSPAGSGDSAILSGLGAQVADYMATEQARLDHRVAELATLYAGGNYQPDSSALSKAMISRALSVDGVES